MQVEVTFVIEPLDRELVAGRDLPPASEAAALEELDTFVHRNAAWSGREPATRLLYGEAEKEIRERAGEWHADLVVLGTHGRGGFERFLLGSVAADVVRRGPTSVLVIPPETAPEALHAVPAAGEGGGLRLSSGPPKNRRAPLLRRPVFTVPAAC